MARGNPVDQSTTDKGQAEMAASWLRDHGHVGVKIVKRTRGELWKMHGAYKPVYIITTRGQARLVKKNPGRTVTARATRTIRKGETFRIGIR
jgi:hypothetical protein